MASCNLPIVCRLWVLAATFSFAGTAWGLACKRDQRAWIVLVDASCTSPATTGCDGMCYEGPADYLDGSLLGVEPPYAKSPVTSYTVTDPVHIRNASCSALGFTDPRWVPDDFYNNRCDAYLSRPEAMAGFQAKVGKNPEKHLL